MARQTWSVEKLVADVWTADGTIYRPNEAVSFDKESTMRKFQLADGSNAFITPETKDVTGPLSLVWLEIPSTDGLKAKLEAYIDAGDDVRITDHLGGVHTGRFQTLRPLLLTGVTNTYDIETIFERTV